MVNDLEHAAKLLAWGSNINTQDDFGASPLIHAVMLKNPEIVTWLLDRGARIGLKNINGETALSIATSNESAAIFKILISQPRKHPITFYYDGLTASQVLNDPDLVMRDYLISLCLKDPNDESDR